MKDYEEYFDDYDDEDTDYDDYDYEAHLLQIWCTCKFEDGDSQYKECDECDHRDECLENAKDNKDGYDSFCDIVSDAYGSVDAFWECNGI